jgi:putative Ca2+/H+ antiporter (TMEM165/GDT1 family)
MTTISPALDAFLVSTGLVALAEIGDKTQLLALALAARYRRVWAITAGLLLATVLNHALAGALGGWLATLFSEQTLRWGVGIAFVLMAGWVLIPDKLDDDELRHTARSAFTATLVLFFLAEMGDKTQIATIALAARFDEAIVAVVFGTTLGMALANVPVVFAGARFADRLPVVPIRWVSAGLFLGMGVLTLLWG